MEITTHANNTNKGGGANNSSGQGFFGASSDGADNEGEGAAGMEASSAAVGEARLHPQRRLGMAPPVLRRSES